MSKFLYAALVAMVIAFMPLKSHADHTFGHFGPCTQDDVDAGICTSVDPTPVPEPSTLGLLLLGAAGIWIARKKFK